MRSARLLSRAYVSRRTPLTIASPREPEWPETTVLKSVSATKLLPAALRMTFIKVSKVIPYAAAIERTSIVNVICPAINPWVASLVTCRSHLLSGVIRRSRSFEIVDFPHAPATAKCRPRRMGLGQPLSGLPMPRCSWSTPNLESDL